MQILWTLYISKAVSGVAFSPKKKIQEASLLVTAGSMRRQTSHVLVQYLVLWSFYFTQVLCRCAPFYVISVLLAKSCVNSIFVVCYVTWSVEGEFILKRIL